MALVKQIPANDVENDYWIDFDQAYIKIDKRDLRIDFEKGVVIVPVRVYPSPEARKQRNGAVIMKKKYVFEIDDDFNISGSNDMLTYCYRKLKQLPEFSEAEDA